MADRDHSSSQLEAIDAGLALHRQQWLEATWADDAPAALWHDRTITRLGWWRCLIEQQRAIRPRLIGRRP